jgi:hypothetical protein
MSYEVECRLKESNETGSVPDLAFSKKRATLLENNL